jgi:hypothetical protein
MLSITVAWSCGIAAMGYAARYLNHDSRFRKLANEAIYPFYLLHQPLIIIFAWPLIQWDIPAWSKALLIASSSFVSAVGIYWYGIRRFRITRLLFGMKVQPRGAANGKKASKAGDFKNRADVAAVTNLSAPATGKILSGVATGKNLSSMATWKEKAHKSPKEEQKASFPGAPVSR